MTIVSIAAICFKGSEEEGGIARAPEQAVMISWYRKIK